MGKALATKKIVILFKDEKMVDEFDIIAPKLRGLVCDIAWFSQFCFDKQITITSLIRTDNKKSVHYYGRGADLRVWDYTSDEIKQIVDYVNSNYPYSRFRPRLKTCIYHDVGQGPHFHLQVKS